MSRILRPRLRPQLLAAALVLGLSSAGMRPAVAVVPPYDEAADAPAEVRAAFATARAEGKPVLLVFGANWCLGCRLLHDDMTEPELARFIGERFVVVNVNVGDWDRNLDLVAAWGDPVAEGLPGIVVATPEGEALLTARSTQVAVAQRLDPGAFRALFEELAELARSRAVARARDAR